MGAGKSGVINNRDAMRRFTLAFILLNLAVFALPLILIAAGTVNVFVGVDIGFGGATIWLAGITLALKRYGVRAFWLSLTAPVGLFWPLFLARWIYGAWRGDPNWMLP